MANLKKEIAAAQAKLERLMEKERVAEADRRELLPDS